MTKLAVPMPDLGAYLREQREQAQMSLRQLADAAGVSNPYLSQIERGLRRPSAEILSALAKALRISAESLYVRAGLLDDVERTRDAEAESDVARAIARDARLSTAQRKALLDLHALFVAETDPAPAADRPRTTASKQSKTAVKKGK